MPAADDEKEMFYQNLVDMGCTHKQIRDYTILMSEENYSVLLKDLKSQRRLFLEYIHNEQKKLDYLDYLVNKIEKDMRKMTKKI